MSVYEDPPLCIAARDGNLEEVKELIRDGADIEDEMFGGNGNL